MSVPEPDWTYPSVLLVFMVGFPRFKVIEYSMYLMELGSVPQACALYELISPIMIMPLASVYFGLAGLVYKFQVTEHSRIFPHDFDRLEPPID